MFVDTVAPQNERQQSVNTPSTEHQQSMNTVSTECQQSVNAFGCCIMYIPRALLQHMSIMNVLAAVLCKCDRDMVTALVWKWASTERQRSCVLHLVSSKGCAMAFIHNRSIGSLSRQYRFCWYRYTSKWVSTEHQHSINRASTEHQHSVNRVSTECQQSVNALECCIMYIPRALLWHMSIINVLAAILCKCDRDMVTAPVWEWSSTERQRFCVLHLV